MVQALVRRHCPRCGFGRTPRIGCDRCARCGQPLPRDRAADWALIGTLIACALVALLAM